MSPRFDTRLATASDREQIYRIRHAVYADELGQHAGNAEASLQDSLDAENEYIVVMEHATVVAFVAVTPPTASAFSIDKYFPRPDLPVRFHATLYELRLLTVRSGYRHSTALRTLIRATFDYLRTRGATEAIAIGRSELLGMYERLGFERLGLTTRSGRVVYELMRIDEDGFGRHCARILGATTTPVEPPERPPTEVDPNLHATAYHGGAFFEAVGPRFDALDAKDEVISADVLDAWFDPAPEVAETIIQHIEWSLKTSPPTHAEGVLAALSESRALPEAHFVPGAGSSDLMFRAIRLWVTPRSRVLLLDPTYGEYGHILENVIGCTPHRFTLTKENGYAIDLAALASEFASGHDWIFLVNPNSPTGSVLGHADLVSLLDVMHPGTHLWLDETYVDYVDPAMTLEPCAAAHERVVVCKSLSKCYALSGLRAAYLCGSTTLMSQVRQVTPPWVLGLPTQIAVIGALRNPRYYEAQWSLTRMLREQLSAMLEVIGIDTLGSQANFLLCTLRGNAITARRLIELCRRKKLFLRSLENFGSRIDAHTFRIAVKDPDTNRRMVEILAEALAMAESVAEGSRRSAPDQA